MSYQCENCQSLFFKTLETRICSENSAIYYKKRCKRCKYKYLVRKTIPNGSMNQVSRQEWLDATKIQSAGPAGISMRAKILVGEYTQKISNPTDKMQAYLRRIQLAEQRSVGDATP